MLNNQIGTALDQTRMGVEQVFVDHLDRAKHYGEKWNNNRQKNLKINLDRMSLRSNRR